MTKIENLKDELVMTLFLMANKLGRNKLGLSEEFLKDSLYAVDTMNFKVVEQMLIKLKKGKYGKINLDL